MQTLVRSLFFVREGRNKKVRVITENDSKVSINIVEISRGKDGKLQRKTVDTIDVAEATGEQVSEFINKAFATPATSAGKK